MKLATQYKEKVQFFEVECTDHFNVSKVDNSCIRLGLQGLPWITFFTLDHEKENYSGSVDNIQMEEFFSNYFPTQEKVISFFSLQQN